MGDPRYFQRQHSYSLRVSEIQSGSSDRLSQTHTLMSLQLRTVLSQLQLRGGPHSKRGRECSVESGEGNRGQQGGVRLGGPGGGGGRRVRCVCVWWCGWWVGWVVGCSSPRDPSPSLPPPKFRVSRGNRVNRPTKPSGHGPTDPQTRHGQTPL